MVLSWTHGKTWSDSGFILKVEQELLIGLKGREVKNDGKVARFQSE